MNQFRTENLESMARAAIKNHNNGTSIRTVCQTTRKTIEKMLCVDV